MQDVMNRLKMISVKNSEWSDILPYVQANKLTCHSFMAKGKRLLPQRQRLYYSQPLGI